MMLFVLVSFLLASPTKVNADILGGGSNGCLSGFCVCTNEIACQTIGSQDECLPCAVVNAAGTCNLGIDGLCPCSQSDFDTACGSGDTGTRRLITSSRKLSDTKDDEFVDIMESCGEQEYEVAIYADTHLYAIGIPKNHEESGCPFAATHAVFGSDMVDARKEILLWDEKEDFDSAFQHETLSIGVFKLGELVDAYEGADVSSNGPYDVIKNNCGGFLVNMASSLEVEVDHRVTSYVAKRLVQNAGQEFYEKIRQSINFPSLFPSGGRHLRVSDEELVERLVEDNV